MPRSVRREDSVLADLLLSRSPSGGLDSYIRAHGERLAFHQGENVGLCDVCSDENSGIKCLCVKKARLQFVAKPHTFDLWKVGMSRFLFVWGTMGR